MTAHNPKDLATGEPDLEEARRFLALLDPHATSFTFQTFNDRNDRNAPSLARILHGTLEERAPELARLNGLGGGVFVTINETDGMGRKAENIVRTRAVWVDDDTGPLGPGVDFHSRPSIEVESSPGKHHLYWFVDGLGNEEHRGVMEHMTKVCGSDPNVKDISRVLRLPGFFHMKGEPFLVRVTEARAKRYTREEILRAFPPMNGRTAASPANTPSTRADDCGPLRDAYALAALRSEATALSEESPGGRNKALNVAAMNLGGFVPRRLSRSDVEEALFAACEANGLMSEGRARVRATIKSGLEYGMKTPRLNGLPSSADTDFAGLVVKTELDQEVERLAGLPPLEYDRVRSEAAERLNVRVGTLDVEVKAKRREASTRTEQAAFLDEPTAWPDPVDGSQLLTRLVDTIKAHVVMPEFGAEAVALWIIHAHAHDAAWISPILAIESPEKRCGKTTLMNLIGELVPKRISVSNLTTASLFRCVEKFKPTLLIDEADTFIDENEELRGVLNSGHNRKSAFVIRTVGDEHDPKVFSTWAPKAIAKIKELPDTLRDRSIVIRLRRKVDQELITPIRMDKTAALDELCRMAWRWANDNLEQLRHCDPLLPPGLNDRAADNWRALFAIAETIGGGCPEMAVRTALGLSGSARPDDGEGSHGVALLGDIRSIFEEQNVEQIAPHDLLMALLSMEESPWTDYRMGRSITDKAVAGLLRPFGIRSQRTGERRYYSKADFVEAWSRYLHLS